MKLESGIASFIISGLQGNKEQKKIAFKRLHDEFWKPICRRLISVERCTKELAEEITQETFINVYKAVESGRLPEPQALYSWVVVISKRVLIDNWRNKQTEQSPEFRDIKNKINDELKKVSDQYTEALESKNTELINSAFIQYISIKEKADNINSMATTFSYSDFQENDSQADNQGAEFTGAYAFGEENQQSSVVSINLEKTTSNKSTREQLHDCIMNALKNLRKISADRAEVLSLDIEELSTFEISQIIGRSEMATRKFLSDSRKAFRIFAEPCRALKAY